MQQAFSTQRSSLEPGNTKLSELNFDKVHCFRMGEDFAEEKSCKKRKPRLCTITAIFTFFTVFFKFQLQWLRPHNMSNLFWIRTNLLLQLQRQWQSFKNRATC